MKPLEFEEVNVRIAEHQDEYQTLPAYVNAEEGSVTFGFLLSDAEVEEVKATGVIWVKTLTFGHPMQPILLSAKKSDVIGSEDIILECDVCGEEISYEEHCTSIGICKKCLIKIKL